MNLLNCIWQPEILISTSYAQLTTPPCGKPDPHLERIPHLFRRRVMQNAQKGPTCLYYAARRISPHFGKKAHSFERWNEMIVSNVRKHLSTITTLDTFPLVEEEHNFFVAYFIIFYTRVLHPFYETGCIDNFLKVSLLLPQRIAQPPLKVMLSECLKMMLHRMHIKPLAWDPSQGPWGLLSALKAHLYLLCMGDFGSHVFQYQVAIDYHPKLGPIYTGPLKAANRPLFKIFSTHAVLVIGIIIKNFRQGAVYFMDPNDPSGPGILQKVYVMRIQDFFARMRNIEGLQEGYMAKQGFIWGGDPALFLA